MDRFPNLLLAPETVTIPNLVCETTATARFVVMNLTAGALVLTSTLQTLSLDSSEPSEFTLEQTVSPVMPGGASETVIVRYTPKRFGNKSVQVTVSDIARNVLARTLILAGRDSLRIDPPAPNVNLGLLPAKTVAVTTVTVRNSGNTPLVWSTAATRSSEGNIFIMSVSPNPTPIGASAQVQLRIQPIESPQNFRETLPLYFCGSSTSTAFVQARVLREFPEIDVPALIDAGTLTCETSVQRTIRIQNLGGLPLVINNLTTPTDTLTILGAPTLPLRILPLDSALITVRMSHPGNGVRESKLTIQSNDPQRPLVDVVVRLQRQPPRYTWTPALFRFDRIDIGQTAEQVIEFTNNSQNPYLWTGLPRALTPDFTILSAQPNPTPNGGTSRLTIRFNGSRESGLISTLATLRLDDVCRTETQLGLEAITIQPAPKLVIRSRIPFDTLLCQTDRTESVEMLNAGRATLRVDSLYVETSIGAGRSMMADFAVQNVGATALPIRVVGVDVATSSFRFDLQFRPRSSGLRTNWLVIHSNDTTTNSNGITRVLLTGFNATASFSLSPPILRFPVPSDFATVRDTVLITNTGTQTLQWQGFPRALDSLFTIERVTPANTAPGDTSKAVVRFSGIRTTDDINREITLTNPLCNAAQRIRFLAGTVPQAALREVLPLNFRLLCESEREQALVLENIGNAELLLTQEPRFLNDTLQEARILSAPRNIPAGARANITLLIRPQRTGTRTLRLLITSNDLLAPSREVAIAFTKDSSALAIVPPTLDVGDVSNGVLQAQRFVIENRGTLSQRISTPFQASNITVDSLVPNPIPAGTRATAYIRFAPGTSTTVNGVFTGSLAVQDSCARVSRFTVTARLTDGVVVLPDSVQLPPLGEADMPIFLRRRSGVVVGTNASFTVRIANTSLVQVLSPLQAAQGVVQNRVENGVRIIRFSVNVPSEQDTVPLVVMRLRGLLGNDSVTTITADSAFVGATPIRGSVSRFRTLGLNYSGGKPRLYYSPTIRLIAPNPASEEISVKIDAAESADATLRLVNVLGQGLTLFTGRLSAGEQDFHFPLSAIPTGTYILELRSISFSGQPAASERSTMHLHIVR
ncbi:MAG: choice-of-anchor D domain-containing protein [Candidatus Kapaibacteriota bacterium]